MAHTKKMFCLLLALCMMLSAFAGVAETAETVTPLVVGEAGEFSEKFSMFFADTAYDNDITDLTNPGLLTTDRVGGIVFNAIEGETIAYNGTDYTYTGPADVSVNFDKDADITTYTVKLRDDLKFSDGEAVTADDLIFTYYVYLDPAYVGSVTLNSYDIIGLQNYQTQTSDDVYAEFSAKAAEILAAGADHEWTEADSWTKEEQEGYWAIHTEKWTKVCQDIVDYVYNNYAADYAQDTVGYSAEEVGASEGLKVAMGMALWGFGETVDGVFTSSVTGDAWTLAEAQPTIEDYYKATYAAYAGDAEEFFGVEAPDANATTVLAGASAQFISQFGASGAEGGVPNIAGIKKLDDYTVEVKVDGYKAPAIYSITSIGVAPLHYYGDEAQYDYENNQFGHPFGDLSLIQAKTSYPVGMGPYKFVKYENRTVYMEANEHYYKGEPKIKYLQFVESDSSEIIAGVATGTIDLGEPSGSTADMADIASYNTDTNAIDGAVLKTSLVDYQGYGFVGCNANNVSVGGVADSAESKNLRKGLMTVLSVYRDVTVDSYYGPTASTIQYPISNTSWAAPQATDEGYVNAFSIDVDGNPIYTEGMTADEKYAAAINAAIGYLKAAGYTWDEATSTFTAAPEGAKLSYECHIGADGTGDHPTFAALTDASAALATIGIELKVTDLTDINVMWNANDAGVNELWCAAWEAFIDPDMYQVYHSTSIPGKGGSDSNAYAIADAALDELIVEARTSDDQAFRKAIYKQALDIIADWAVELPVYQRKTCIVFSEERIDTSTLTPDMTAYWDWTSEIEKVEMK